MSGEEEKADGEERLARLDRERAKPRDSSLGGILCGATEVNRALRSSHAPTEQLKA